MAHLISFDEGDMVFTEEELPDVAREPIPSPTRPRLPAYGCSVVG